MEIGSLSFSNYSNEFLIHVPSEYDLRLASSKQRIPFVATVVKAKLAMTSDFRIYFHNASFLTSWETYFSMNQVFNKENSGGLVRELYKHQ